MSVDLARIDISSNIMNAPIVASSWLSWKTKIMTYLENRLRHQNNSFSIVKINKSSYLDIKIDYMNRLVRY